VNWTAPVPVKSAMKQLPIKVIVKKHPNGYVAYPLGVKGVVVGQGRYCQTTLDDVRSALSFHIDAVIAVMDTPSRR